MSAAEALLRWYDRRGRDLPWRRTRDPWAILLSELMLQQTRVETVVPYYERFLERFPTAEDMAAADVEEVLGLWSGLGYYQRARRLHEAARRIAASGGRVPSTMSELLELPGVGPYTAAAVGSIAFGLVEPVLDGNVERVVGRLLALEVDPKSAEGRRTLLTRAAALLDPARPGDSNQALMELGATVCSVREPGCGSCPLAPECRAAALGAPEAFPPPRRRRAVERRRIVVAVVVDERGRAALFRRPDDATLLAGMWELPWVEVRAGRRPAGEVAGALGSRYGGAWSLGERLGVTRHAITHRALEVEVVEARLAPSTAIAEGPEAGWFGREELARLPVSSLVRKILSGTSFDERPD